MIQPRSTTIYEPKNHDYGATGSPVKKSSGHGAGKKPAPSTEGGWRDSNNYRSQYFQKNHGIGGYGYICSQCWKPMFKKENIQVDHIIPPSRFAVKKRKKGKWVKTSIMARFLNNSFNCAAICGDCNRRKSNKINTQIIQGYVMKSLEVLYGTSQLLLSIPFMAVASCMWALRKIVITSASLAGGGGGSKSSKKSKRR